MWKKFYFVLYFESFCVIDWSLIFPVFSNDHLELINGGNTETGLSLHQYRDNKNSPFWVKSDIPWKQN